MKKIIAVLIIVMMGLSSAKLKAQCLGAPSFSTSTVDICDNSTYFFNNANLNIAGIYYDTTVNYVGCDSIIELWLMVNSPATGFAQQSICAGGSYFFNGVNLTTSGFYNDTFINPAICDFVFTLSLKVIQPSISNVTKSICSGSFYFFNNQVIAQAGLYYDTLINYLGCVQLLN